MNKDIEILEDMHAADALDILKRDAQLCEQYKMSIESRNALFDNVSQALEAQSKAVDVMGLKVSNGSIQSLAICPDIDPAIWCIVWNECIDHLNKQGHLTSSEKPTGSISDDKEAVIKVAKGDGE